MRTHRSRRGWRQPGSRAGAAVVARDRLETGAADTSDDGFFFIMVMAVAMFSLLLFMLPVQAQGVLGYADFACHMPCSGNLGEPAAIPGEP